jgi:hypothetical protein
VQDEVWDTFFSVLATLKAENKVSNFLLLHLVQVKFFSSDLLSINTSKISSQPVHLNSLNGIM